MKSLSEIDTTSKRASRAVGFSWGEAEEIGKSIRLLELFGLQGIKNLNNYYHLKTNNKYENLNLIKENNISEKNPYCPIKLGINFLDQIRIVEKYKKITFKLENFDQSLNLYLPNVKFLISSKNSITVSYEKNSISFEQLINYIKEKNLKILDISIDEGDLEDVFIQLTKS